MTQRNDWITADLDGLARLVEDRPRAFIIYELLSNALDEETHNIEITLLKGGRRPLARLVVTDDNPEGFKDLSHAWRMFADSAKKDKADKRGRFNVGEKLVLALCTEARITTTTGTVYFEAAGRRFDGKVKTNTGSRFEALIRMTQDQLQDTLTQARWALIPAGVTVRLNGEVLEPRTPVSAFETTLATVIGDEDGVLRRSRRRTLVEIFQPRAGEKAMIYELGIPVVETGDTYHVNVRQKVPLNTDRDNVTPGFLKEVRAAVLEHTHTLLDNETATSDWVTDALGQKGISSEAVHSVITHRFGPKAVITDPSDREATQRAAGQGYTVVHGGTFGTSQWANIRAARALKPAGQVFPTQRPLSAELDPSQRREVPRDQWTEPMHQVVALTHRLAARLMEIRIQVFIVNKPDQRFDAWYGSHEFTYNLACLGRRFFAAWLDAGGGRERVLDLIIHEFGHQYESSHLDDNYHRATTRLGARMSIAALEDPTLFLPVVLAHAPAPASAP